MPSLNTTYLALPVAPAVPVIALEPGRKYAEVCYDAMLLPPELQAILENPSNSMATRLFKGVQSVLQDHPEAHRAQLRTSSTFGRFEGLPLDTARPVARVISRIVSECLAREMEPVPA